jgi:hypothetical protein
MLGNFKRLLDQKPQPVFQLWPQNLRCSIGDQQRVLRGAHFGAPHRRHANGAMLFA